MQIGVVKETWPGEVRTSMVPANVAKLVKIGFSIVIEKNAGEASGFADTAYEEAGARIESDRGAILGSSQVLLGVRKFELAELDSIKKDTVCISFLDPYNEKH